MRKEKKLKSLRGVGRSAIRPEGTPKKPLPTGGLGGSCKTGKPLCLKKVSKFMK